MLVENKITENGIEEVDKVQVAINRLKAFEPKEGYWLAFSGGKDSVVVKKLAEMSGVKFESHYSVTSVDPPKLVRFVKSLPDVSFDIPRDKTGGAINMWNLIASQSMPPTRLARYCCQKLKESNGAGMVTITGVRWAESVRRKTNNNLVNVSHYDKSKRLVFNNDNDEAKRMVEQCFRTRKTLVNPIIDWSDEDVWEFIHKYNVPYCELYDEGYKRLGCIGCPMSYYQKEELEKYPKIKQAYIRAFDKMLKNMEMRNIDTTWKTGNIDTTWKTGKEVYDWWVSNSKTKRKWRTKLDV